MDIFTVGRGSDRSLVLDGARSISRDHAEIRRRGDSYVLKNTQGQGGTYINGSKMGIDEPLKNGDQIGLGGPDPKVVFHDKRVRRAAV